MTFILVDMKDKLYVYADLKVQLKSHTQTF